ncbi:hypothetical protein [Ferrimonas kyonanensis]|uniref:hypothetical protein n=1 Tax=Ferrimonas kyonanensis TaxID=364763 RepID=UPI000487B1A0|nr:hypothetical protein [Ferrimonas kyonanensis]
MSKSTLRCTEKASLEIEKIKGHYGEATANQAINRALENHLFIINSLEQKKEESRQLTNELVELKLLLRKLFETQNELKKIC